VAIVTLLAGSVAFADAAQKTLRLQVPGCTA
jgi:hypothetical protein